jgi:nucleoside-diphosphate-sugar epimerase
MRLAILGASSQIAKDLIRGLLEEDSYELVLYARHPADVKFWLGSMGRERSCTTHDFGGFNHQQQFDAIINFVGSGNPAKTALMGSSIMDVTYQYDELALDYLKKHPGTRYIFLSSGAAYGSDFTEPANKGTVSTFNLNGVTDTDWYGIAKFYSECRHRSLAAFPIVDLRVFNYFSRTQDLEARFLICDILRAIHSKSILQTSGIDVVRDYLNPSDFLAMVQAVLKADPINVALDCFSRSPVAKFELLVRMKEEFGLQYEIQPDAGLNATGHKSNYFSRDHSAIKFGYSPSMTSLESVLTESAAILNSLR